MFLLLNQYSTWIFCISSTGWFVWPLLKFLCHRHILAVLTSLSQIFSLNFWSSSLGLSALSVHKWDFYYFFTFVHLLGPGVDTGSRFATKIRNWGLPWWCSGWESACQCRGHELEPWSGKIPHAAEQLGPWATTTEPACLEPVLRNKRGRDSERPAHHDEEWPLLAATRESPHTETRTQNSQK